MRRSTHLVALGSVAIAAGGLALAGGDKNGVSFSDLDTNADDRISTVEARKDMDRRERVSERPVESTPARR